MRQPRIIRSVRRVLVWPHERLVSRSRWYRLWHETPHHHQVHRRIATHATLATTTLVGAKALGILALIVGLNGSAHASTTKTWTSATDWQSWNTTNIDSTTASGSLSLRSTSTGGPSAGQVFNYNLWNTTYNETPVSPTVDRQGRIWFVNPERNKIFTLDPTTGVATQRVVASGYYIESISASRTTDHVWMVGITFGGVNQEATDERLYRINNFTYDVEQEPSLVSLDSSLAPRGKLVNYIERTDPTLSACDRFFCEATTVFAGSNGQLYLFQRNPADYWLTSAEDQLAPATAYVFNINENTHQLISIHGNLLLGNYQPAPYYISDPAVTFNPISNQLIITQYNSEWKIGDYYYFHRTNQIAATVNGGTELNAYQIDSGQPTYSIVDNNGVHWHANQGAVCHYIDQSGCVDPLNNYLFYGAYAFDNNIADISYYDVYRMLSDSHNRLWVLGAGWSYNDYGARIKIYDERPDYYNRTQRYTLTPTVFGDMVASQDGSKIYTVANRQTQEFNVDSVDTYASTGEISTSFAPNPGQNNDWESYSATTSTPTNTSLSWSFSADNSNWYSSLASVPNSSRLYIKAAFATTDATATPTLDDLTINYTPVVVDGPSKTWTTEADFNTFTHNQTAVTADGDGATALSTSGGGSGGWSQVSSIPSFAGGWFKLFATADNNIWVASDNNIAQYNGSSWIQHNSVVSSGTSIKAILSFGQNDTWVFSDYGAAVHWNGSSWTPQYVQLADTSWAIFRSAWGTDSSHIWAGANGAIMYYNGSTWTQQIYPGSCIGNFLGVSGTSTSNVWAANDAGWSNSGCASGWRFNGTSWALALDAAPIGLTSVYSPDSTHAWFTDYIGSTVYYAQAGSTSFTPASTGGASYLKDIDGTGPNDIWAVGTLSGGYNVAHYDGTSWTSSAATTADDLVDVDAVSTTSVYALSGSILYHYSASGGTYQTPGDATVTYTPSAGTTNRWQSDVLETTLPAGTSATVSYSADNSTWHNAIADVPASESLYVKLSLSTTDTAATPLVTALTVYYAPISVTYSLPEAGQTIRYNTADRVLPVAWSASGASGTDHIRLSYSTNSGSSWTDISGATALNPTLTNFNWTLPTINSTHARVRIQLEDASNNVLASAATGSDFSLLYDATSPTLTVSATSDNANPNIATTGNTITISVTSDEPLAEAPTVYLGDVLVTCTGSSQSYSCAYTVTDSSPNGHLAITVNAVDLTGNATTDTGQSFVISFSIPQIGITSPGNGSGYYQTDTGTATITGFATDDDGLSSVTSSYAGSVTGTTNWSQDVSLNAGQNVITYTATNTAGRQSKATIVIDYLPGSNPTITITSPTTAGVYVANVAQLTISGTAAGDGATVSSVTSSDASAVVTGTTSWSQTVDVPANSDRTITYYVIDEYGRVGFASIRLIHDDSAPTIAITSPAATGSTYYTANSSLTISGTASAPSGVASVTSSASGSVTGTTNWSQPVTLTQESQVFTYTVTDYLGQTAAVSITIVLDQTAPSIAITGPSTNGSYTTDQPTVTVTGTASDNASLASISSSDGTVTGTNTWSQDVSLNAGQTKNLTYTATDSAGNTNTANIQINRLAVNPDVPDPNKPPVTTSNPDPIRNLQTFVSPSAVILQYSPLPAGQAVKIWRSTISGQIGDLLTETNLTSFTDQAVTAGSTYYYTLIVVRLDDGRTSTPVTTTATISASVGWAIDVTPATVSLKPGGRAQMQATVYDAWGHAQSVPVTWSVDARAGSIDQAGLFTAGSTTGDYYRAITARVDYQGLTGVGTSDVFVDPTDNQISYFSLTPSGVTVTPGGTVNFHLYALNQNGAALNLSDSQATWQTTVGQINNGVFTAPNQTGTYAQAVSATYTDPSGRVWTAYADVTVSTESPHLSLITISGTQRLPFNTSVRYSSYAYDQFNNRYNTNVPTLFALNDNRAGQIDSIGRLQTGNTAGCYYWSVLAEKQEGSTLARARSGVVVAPYTTEELARYSQPLVSLYQIKFVHQPNSRFAFSGLVYNGWGQIMPHHTVVWRLANPAVGTITENGQFQASGQTGIYPDALEIYTKDLNTGITTLYTKYPLVISTEASRPTFLSTLSISAAANSAGRTALRVYDQFGLPYIGSFVRRFTLLGGNSQIYQNGLVETGDPETSRNVIIGYLNNGQSTETAAQGNVFTGASYAPTCSLTATTDPSSDGQDDIIDANGTGLIINPARDFQPGSLIDQANHSSTTSTPISIPLQTPVSPLTGTTSWIQKILTPLSALAILTSLPTVLAGLLETLSQLFGRAASWLANLLQAISSYRRPRAYGQVIDGRTKMPVAGATVQLLTPDTRRVIDTRQTDSAGRYVLITSDRQSLLLSATAPHYQPQTKLVRGESIHQTIRLGLEIEHDEPAISRKVFWQRAFRLLSACRTTLLVFGTTAWIITLLGAPSKLLFYLGFYYLIAWILEWYIATLPRPYGVVQDAATNQPLARSIVRILNRRQKLIGTEITDNHGRFRTILTPGVYTFTYAKAGYESASHFGAVLPKAARSFRLDASLHRQSTPPSLTSTQ